MLPFMAQPLHCCKPYIIDDNIDTLYMPQDSFCQSKGSD